MALAVQRAIDTPGTAGHVRDVEPGQPFVASGSAPASSSSSMSSATAAKPGTDDSESAAVALIALAAPTQSASNSSTTSWTSTGSTAYAASETNAADAGVAALPTPRSGTYVTVPQPPAAAYRPPPKASRRSLFATARAVAAAKSARKAKATHNQPLNPADIPPNGQAFTCTLPGCTSSFVCVPKEVDHDAELQEVVYSDNREPISNHDCPVVSHLEDHKDDLCKPGHNGEKHEWTCLHQNCGYSSNKHNVESHLLSGRYHQHIRHFLCAICKTPLYNRAGVVKHFEEQHDLKVGRKGPGRPSLIPKEKKSPAKRPKPMPVVAPAATVAAGGGASSRIAKAPATKRRPPTASASLPEPLSPRAALSPPRQTRSAPADFGRVPRNSQEESQDQDEMDIDILEAPVWTPGRGVTIDRLGVPRVGSGSVTFVDDADGDELAPLSPTGSPPLNAPTASVSAPAVLVSSTLKLSDEKMELDTEFQPPFLNKEEEVIAAEFNRLQRAKEVAMIECQTMGEEIAQLRRQLARTQQALEAKDAEYRTLVKQAQVVRDSFVKIRAGGKT